MTLAELLTELVQSTEPLRSEYKDHPLAGKTPAQCHAAGEDTVLVAELNVPRQDIRVLKTYTSDMILAAVTPTMLEDLTLAESAYLTLLKPGMPITISVEHAELFHVLKLPIMRDGSLCEREGLPPATIDDLADILNEERTAAVIARDMPYMQAQYALRGLVDEAEAAQREQIPDDDPRALAIEARFLAAQAVIQQYVTKRARGDYGAL